MSKEQDLSDGWPDTETSSSEYVHFDEREDVLASLDLLELITPQLDARPAYWKWAIIGAHDALQGAMVCALADTTGTSVLKDDSRRKILEWLDNDNHGKPPQERLATFDELLDLCQDQLQFALEAQQIDALRRLHRYFRNDFAHFTPKGWSIDKTGLPYLIGTALYAIELLMRETRVVMHLEEADQRRLARALKIIRASLDLI